MKLYKLIPALMLAACVAGCDDDFDRPPVILPEATIHPNSTILEVKTRYWQNDRNYATQIGLTDDNEHVIVAGRVISNGESGNVYKSLIIQDGTAALSFSINDSKLYNTYALGQEVVVDLTEMNIGKYNGLQQVGQAQAYQQGYEVSFMELEDFQTHAQPNELPEPSKISTINTSISELTSSTAAEHLCKWQSQLIRLDSVRWEEAGQPYAASNASTNRYLVDKQGKKILVRNSNYATFASDIIPSGTGSVVAIASYYGTDWQLLLRNTDDVIGFDNATPDTPVTPEQPTGEAMYGITNTLQPDLNYVFVIGNQIGTVIGEKFTYGRLALEDVTITDNTLTTSTANQIMIKAVEGGYVLIDSFGRYLSMDDSHLTSFQLYTSQMPGSVWTWADGRFTNALNTQCRIGQDVNSSTGERFPNIAPSKSDDLVYPAIYVKQS